MRSMILTIFGLCILVIVLVATFVFVFRHAEAGTDGEYDLAWHKYRKRVCALAILGVLLGTSIAGYGRGFGLGEIVQIVSIPVITITLCVVFSRYVESRSSKKHQPY